MLHAYRRHRLRPVRRPTTDAAARAGAHEETEGFELVEALENADALDACDAYVVLVVDPETGAVDSYGPLTGPDAVVEAERRRRDLDAGDLGDVDVRVVRHHALRVLG